MTDGLEKRMQAGEAAAFDEVVGLFHESLFRLCRRMLGNDADAQEAVQEAFLAAYQGREKFRGEARVRTWLLSIAYNKCLDRLRRASRDQWILEGHLESSPLWDRVAMVQDFTDWGANPEQNFHKEAMREALRDALVQLPALSRAVFELCDMQGMTGREAAQATGISEAAARVRLHRVRQYLMVAMQDFFEQGGGNR